MGLRIQPLPGSGRNILDLADLSVKAVITFRDEALVDQLARSSPPTA